MMNGVEAFEWFTVASGWVAPSVTFASATGAAVTARAAQRDTAIVFFITFMPVSLSRIRTASVAP